MSWLILHFHFVILQNVMIYSIILHFHFGILPKCHGLLNYSTSSLWGLYKMSWFTQLFYTFTLGILLNVMIYSIILHFYFGDSTKLFHTFTFRFLLGILCLVSSVGRALASKLRGPGLKSWPGTVGGRVTIIMWGARPGWKLALS